MTAYEPPVDKLLSYGNCLELEEMPNYVEELGFGTEHIPELIRMGIDLELHFADMDSLESWAPVHAWRTLGQLRATEAIEPLITLFHKLDDDWSANELPEIFGMLGPAAIPALKAYLSDSSRDCFDLAAVANSFTKIAEKNPDVRDECIAILTQQLELFADNDSDYNGFLIDELLDLNAVESAPVIERAFAAGRVSAFLVGDWDDVQVSLGLKDASEVPEPKFTVEEILYHSVAELQPQKSLGFAPSSTQKKKAKKNKKRK